MIHRNWHGKTGKEQRVLIEKMKIIGDANGLEHMSSLRLVKKKSSLSLLILGYFSIFKG
jgi:hypothetical protein